MSERQADSWISKDYFVSPDRLKGDPTGAESALPDPYSLFADSPVGARCKGQDSPRGVRVRQGSVAEQGNEVQIGEELQGLSA